jgi:hypothetical protein
VPGLDLRAHPVQVLLASLVSAIPRRDAGHRLITALGVAWGQFDASIA